MEVKTINELMIAQKGMELKDSPEMRDLSKSITEIKHHLPGKIKDEESEKYAVTCLSQIAGLSKEIDKKQKQVLDAPKRMVKAIQACFKVLTLDLEACKNQVRQNLLTYQTKKRMEMAKKQEKERKAAERLQRSLAKDAEKLGIEAPEVPMPVTEPEPTTIRSEEGKVVKRKIWDLQIIDKMAFIQAVAKKQVPETCLSIETAQVKSLIKADIRNIPGLKIFEKETIAIY